MNKKFIIFLYRLILCTLVALGVGCSNEKDSTPTIKAQENISAENTSASQEISGSINRGTIANAEVELFQLNPDNNRVWSSVAKTLSDQQGRYALQGLHLKPGIYKLVASSLPAGETLMYCNSNEMCDSQVSRHLPEALDQNLNGRIDNGEWFPLPAELELSTLIYHSGDSGDNASINAHLTFLTHWLAQYSEEQSLEQIEFEKNQARLALDLGLSGSLSGIAPVHVNLSQNLTKTQFLQLRTEVLNDVINRAVPLLFSSYDDFLQAWSAQDERFELRISPNALSSHRSQQLTLNDLLSHAQTLVDQSYSPSVESIQFWSDIHLHILALEQRLRTPLSHGAGSDFLNYSQAPYNRLLATKDKARQFLLDLGSVLNLLSDNDTRLEQSLGQVFLLLNSETTNRSHLLVSELLSLEKGLDTILKQQGAEIDQDTLNQKKAQLDQTASDFDTDQHSIMTAIQEQTMDALPNDQLSGYTYQAQTSENTTLTLEISRVESEPHNTHDNTVENNVDESLLGDKPLARSSVQGSVAQSSFETDSAIAQFTGSVYGPTGISTINGTVNQPDVGTPAPVDSHAQSLQTPIAGYSIQTTVEHSGTMPYLFRGSIETRQKLLFSNDQSPEQNLLSINGQLSNPDGREESVAIYVSTATIASSIDRSIKIRNFLVEYQDRHTFNESLSLKLNHSYTIDEMNDSGDQPTCNQSCLNLNNKLSIQFGLKQFHFSIDTQPELWAHNPCGPEAKMITVSNHDSLTLELIIDGSCKSGKMFSNPSKDRIIATLVPGSESGLFSFSETEFFSVYNTLIKYPTP